MDWAYLLLEWLVINALWPSRDRRPPRSKCPEPLFPELEHLEILRGALDSGADVRIVYLAVSSSQQTERVVTPLSLWQAQAGHWLLTAQDHLRGERRTFRVGRMNDVVVARNGPSRVTGEAAVRPVSARSGT